MLNNITLQQIEIFITVAEQLEPLYGRLGDTLTNIRKMYEDHGNVIQIGCNDTNEIREVLMNIVKSFENDHRDTILNARGLHHSELVESLMYGKTDVIITYSIGFGKYLGIATKKVASLDTYLAVSAHSEFANYKEIPVELLQKSELCIITTSEMKELEERMVKTCKNSASSREASNTCRPPTPSKWQ